MGAKKKFVCVTALISWFTLPMTWEIFFSRALQIDFSRSRPRPFIFFPLSRSLPSHQLESCGFLKGT